MENSSTLAIRCAGGTCQCMKHSRTDNAMRRRNTCPAHETLAQGHGDAETAPSLCMKHARTSPVSYTHLTLPTICSV
eukprot:6745715-Alexandrium_andersonii.AAC.1